jgi:hypothetical protein
VEYGAKYLNDIFNLAKNYQIYARIRDTAH